VPQIPRLAKEPKAVIYSPLGEATATLEVVLFACKPAGAMLLQEAANRAGVGSGVPALAGRRAWRCRLRYSMDMTSLGCIGNRVYNGAG